MNKKIACVTGASGMIGRRVVSNLISQGLTVRVLSYRGKTTAEGVEVFRGDLCQKASLVGFLENANYLFHCAGELNNEKKMQSVNVEGTRNLLNLAQSCDLKYFCYLSSAGVVGDTALKWVDESAECEPQNEYERTKFAAEQLAQEKLSGCTTVILRPINVMDESRPDVFGLPLRNTFRSKLFTFIKGKECAHQVHAAYVANVATFFIDTLFTNPEIFFVGNDEDNENTYQGIWNLYSRLSTDIKVNPIPLALPLWVPHLLRNMQGVVANKGDVRYSSKKLSLYAVENTWCLTNTAKAIIKKNGK